MMLASRLGLLDWLNRNWRQKPWGDGFMAWTYHMGLELCENSTDRPILRNRVGMEKLYASQSVVVVSAV